MRPLPIKMDSSVSPKDEICFLRVCHHISNAVYFSADIIRVIELRQMRWANCVACAGEKRNCVACAKEKRNAYWIFVGKN